MCGLCAWQWYEQTIQRDEITTLNGMVYEKNAAIQDDTNSIATLNHQVDQMDARITEIKAAAATNEQLVVSQKAEITQLQFANVQSHQRNRAIQDRRGHAGGEIEGSLRRH